ncbi:MAG: thioredoxin family protein [Clostridiales bacterium]|nr:thioredoxin family protein [Clostridiales bacterium]
MIVPVCIVLIIAGIWIFKNANSDAPPITDNKDFTLEATNIDLEVLTSYELPIIIDFGADSCIPCKEMAPVLKTLNVEMQGAAIIKFVDVWKNEDVANDFPIQVIPTQIFINADGTPYVPSDDIKIEFTMYSTKDTNEHVFTVHQGGLTEGQMRRILTDMGVGK